jgi:broad specificity phosphatase PhoE
VSGTIFLVRHGQTALNAEGRFRGRRDVPLDELGLEQAAGAGRELSGAGIGAVYASPLLRTVQTAQAVADASGVSVTPLEDLIDLDHGRWEALTAEEAAERDPEEFRRFREDPRSSTAPGGEHLADVEARLLSVLGSLAARHDGEPVVAVSHEIPIRLVIAALAGIDGPAFWEVVVPTGSVTRIDHEAGSLTLADDVRMGTT